MVYLNMKLKPFVSRSNFPIYAFIAIIYGVACANSSIQKPYNSASHYWPLDTVTGIRDVITNTTGIRDGRVTTLYFEGPEPGHLFVPKSRVKFGNFEGTCVVDPTKCSTYLTVSLWINYNRRGVDTTRTQFFIGTGTREMGSPGYAIHATPLQGHEERVRIQVNNRIKVWTSYIDVKPKTWTQIGFTWSNTTGLMVFKNCKRVETIRLGLDKNSTGSTGDFLYLVKAPWRGKAAFNISYDDIAVWYKDLKQIDKGLICSKKVGPPVLSSHCSSGSSWISIKWKTSLPGYAILTGFNVWYKYTTSKDWVQRNVNVTIDTYNITGLVPSAAVEIQIQNDIYGGNGQRSIQIICNTTAKMKVIGSPVNLTVEATSSQAILISWKQPDDSVIKGYWVLFKDHDSVGQFTKLEIGLPANNQFLVSGLSKNTTYKMYVVSVGEYPSLPSKELNAITDKDDFKTVQRIQANPSIDLKTLQISWHPPLHSSRSYWYRVFMQWKDGDINKIQEIYTGPSTNYTFVSLTDLPFPQECNVMAMEPTIVKSSVQNATVQSTSWNSAVITWYNTGSHVANEIVDKYRVIVTTSRKSVQFVTDKTKVTIGGLNQMTSYKVNLQQGNFKGFGPLMEHHLSFRTLDANECEGLQSSCEEPGTLVFDNSQCFNSMLQCNLNAQCINTEGSFFCKCNQGYMGDGWMCQEIPRGTSDSDFCKEDTIQGIQWGKTLRGRNDSAPCPKGVTGIARRQCIGPSGKLAMWDIPDLSACVSKWALDMNDMANDPSVSVLSVANQTAKLTNAENINKIYPGDLKVVVNVIGILSEREEKRESPVNTEETSEFTKSIVNTASNILASETIQKWTFIPQTDRKINAGTLLSSMESVATQLARIGNRSSTAMPNVVLNVFSTSNKSSSDYVMIGQREKNSQPCAVFPSSELKKGSQHVTYISYRTMGSLLSPEMKGNTTVDGPVISLTVSGLKQTNFIEPVAIVFTHEQEGIMNANFSCVFWDMSRHSEPGRWSSDGCYVNSTNSSHTVCHCYHLTSFAVLMSVNRDTSALIKGKHKIALTLITYIGCVLSICALCLTFITFLTFRFLKSSRTFIHTNLAFVLAIAQLLFLFGINKTKIKLVCQIIAGALHYIWLASFVWMALEGVMLYLMLVKVFGTKTMTRSKRRVFLTVGWGLPLIVVGVSTGIYPEGYGTEHYCWLSTDHGFIWAFVGPALGVIGFNFLIMGVTFSVMSKRQGQRRKPSKIRKIRYWSKACTLLTCILGLTWLFGVFYINHKTLFMAYFFTIFNSLQGVFIFLFHCIGDEKIRREYVRILCCREKGPPYTMASSTKTPKSEDPIIAGGKLIKSQNEYKGMNFTASTGTGSSDGHKAVLVMYQKRSSYTPSSRSYNRDDSESSQRLSIEMYQNPRDSTESFSSFSRNRYSLTSRDEDCQDKLGELSVVPEVTVHNTSNDT